MVSQENFRQANRKLKWWKESGTDLKAIQVSENAQENIAGGHKGLFHITQLDKLQWTISEENNPQSASFATS